MYHDGLLLVTYLVRRVIPTDDIEEEELSENDDSNSDDEIVYITCSNCGPLD